MEELITEVVYYLKLLSIWIDRANVDHYHIPASSEAHARNRLLRALVLTIQPQADYILTLAQLSGIQVGSELPNK